MSEFERQSLVYSELDVPRCALRYGQTTGEGTCPAVKGVDSEQECWNTRATCPVPLSFVDATVTIRYGQSSAYRPKDIDCMPSLLSAEISPGTIKPGESLGERSTLTVVFQDGPHPDTGLGQYDFYRSERDYDPVAQGSYWGKFRARQQYLRGLPHRIKLGYVGQDFADFESRSFFLESFEGPTLTGTFTIQSKDIFKQLDGDRAVAPEMSNGFLLADISASATSFTLSPVGIGNAEYATSGYLAIGGKEIVAFTRSGDVITITGGVAGRAQLNTEAQAHQAQDRVQTVLEIFGENVADIIKLLMVEYAGVPEAYIPIDDWLTETEGFLGTVCTAYIAEPTPVRKLVDELIEQQALCVWWDDRAELIRLTVLRDISTDAKLFDEHNMAADAKLGIREQPDKRLSRVLTYYAQINPLKAVDDLDNYRSSQMTIDGEAETNNGSSAIKVITSRWIPQNARAVAQKLNNKLLARFRTAPRMFSFATTRYSGNDVELGRGYNIGSPLFQGPDGARVNVPVQVVRLSPMRDRFLVEAEEMRFEQLDDDVDPVDHLVIIDSDSFNVNLRTLHDSQYDEAESGDTVTCIVNEGVTVGSTSTSVAALIIGNGWAAGVDIVLKVRGRIQGKGANGGAGDASAGGAGGSGGVALYTRHPIDLELNVGDAEIWGGAGGGGGGGGGFVPGGGGGGAGTNPGAGGPGAFGGASGSPGTSVAGGAGAVGAPASGGAGGGPGLNGSLGSGAGGAGGAAGAAIDGDSYVTITAGTGDIRGPQIN